MSNSVQPERIVCDIGLAQQHRLCSDEYPLQHVAPSSPTIRLSADTLNMYSVEGPTLQSVAPGCPQDREQTAEHLGSQPIRIAILAHIPAMARPPLKSVQPGYQSGTKRIQRRD